MQLPDRVVKTFLVYPTAAEDALSKQMSQYFHREHLAAFPKIKEHYIRLTYWKLLASSPAALHDSLAKVLRRLEKLPDVDDEQRELQEVAHMAAAIRKTARSAAFSDALEIAMQTLRDSEAPEKAVIFSENRRTLAYLHDLLAKHGYKNKIAIYGSTSKEEALAAFRGKARILLATDSIGLGVDLSHCACVVNYDLPYNVQKLEQRISRCHRYGQKHDVLVLNFIDPTNRADKRLYTLLNRKLKLFDDIFGASETVLGDLQEGTEDLTLQARTEMVIREEIDQFERENKGEIDRRVQKAEADLLAHFDEDVRARFKKIGEEIPQAISRMEGTLWELTRYKLAGKAVIDEEHRRLIVDKSPYRGLRLSRISFGMDKSLPRGERYHMAHPLAKRLLEDCLSGELAPGFIALEAGGVFTSGLTGEIGLWRHYRISGVEFQSVPVLCGYVKGGGALTGEQCTALLKLPVLSCTGGEMVKDENGVNLLPSAFPNETLVALRDAAFEALQNGAIINRDEALAAEIDKLRRWAEDEAAALARQKKELPERIAKMKAEAASAADFTERFRRNKEIAELAKEQKAEEERLFYLAAEIEQRRKVLIDQAKEKSTLRFWDEQMFIVRWKIG